MAAVTIYSDFGAPQIMPRMTVKSIWRSGQGSDVCGTTGTCVVNFGFCSGWPLEGFGEGIDMVRCIHWNRPLSGICIQTYCVPGPVLGHRNTTVSSPSLMNLTVNREDQALRKIPTGMICAVTRKVWGEPTGIPFINRGLKESVQNHLF